MLLLRMRKPECVNWTFTYHVPNCATRVAIAAPRSPIPKIFTNKKSPIRLTTVEYNMAINGVTESLAPKSADWRTPNSKEVGRENALILT